MCGGVAYVGEQAIEGAVGGGEELLRGAYYRVGMSVGVPLVGETVGGIVVMGVSAMDVMDAFDALEVNVGIV